MKVDFQIIHSFDSDTALKEKLLDLLKETIDESTTTSIEIEKRPKNIKDWLIFRWIEIKYNYRSNKKYIAGFSLNTEGFNVNTEGFSSLNTEKESKVLVHEFGQKLQNNSDIDLVIKYNDESMQIEYQKYAKEIFELEMELREVISFIFLDTYKNDYYNLLKEMIVSIQNLDKKNKPDKYYFKAHFENEFFFLLFSDYININSLKELNHSGLNNLIRDSDSFEDLKRKMQSRGILKEKYQDFIAGIKQDLNPIEKLRNCIAHNRSISERNNYRMIVDYDKAKKALEDLINNFWNDI
jgi:hypothetical protein